MVQVFGGEAGCEHEWGDTITTKGTSRWDHFEKDGGVLVKSDYSDSKTAEQGCFCRLCGAWRGELGLEPIADCGRPFMELRDDLSDKDREYVLSELKKLGLAE